MNKHVVVTGASSGIGEALVKAFAREGAAVTMVARRREVLERLASQAAGRTHVVAADLSDPAQYTSWLPAAEAALGPVDILVNNAGVQIVGPTPGLDTAACDAMLRVDLMAPLHLCAAVLPAMVGRRAGTIVNISSMAAIAPTPGMAWYNAAKGGLAAYSESLRGELRTSGVNVLTVYPGPVDTPMADRTKAATQGALVAKAVPEGTPAGLADRVLDAVERRDARLIYPGVYAVSRHFPAITRLVLDYATPPFGDTSRP